jgi:hypothetical protein
MVFACMRPCIGAQLTVPGRFGPERTAASVAAAATTSLGSLVTPSSLCFCCLHCTCCRRWLSRSRRESAVTQAQASVWCREKSVKRPPNDMQLQLHLPPGWLGWAGTETRHHPPLHCGQNRHLSGLVSTGRASRSSTTGGLQGTQCSSHAQQADMGRDTRTAMTAVLTASSH